MINTIFYFVKDLETYRNKLLEEGISSRTIVFVTKEKLIMKGGQPYGGMTTSDITDLIWQNINGERFQTFLQGYVSDQLAEVDLGAVWSKIDEVEGRIASAESTIRAVASQTESFITAQTSANTELQNALSILQTKVTNIDGQLVAISTLGTRLTDVEGWINSANFVSVSTFNEAMASMSAAIDNIAEPPARCSLAEWSDLPVATTDEYPYLWMRIQEKNENGEITSTSYFRITSDDHRYDSAGNCVDAQFSMTQTPSAANIHSPYQVGDIYMRYKLPTESFSGDVDEDHPWVAMAFEDERDVNYSFNTSKNPAIGMAQVIVDIQNNEGFLTEAKLLTILGNRTGSVYTGIKGIADDVVAGVLAEVTDDDGKVTASSIVEALANDTEASTQMQSYFTTTVDNSTIESIVETKLNASVTGATWSEFVSTTNSTNSSYAGLASTVGGIEGNVSSLLSDVSGLDGKYDAVNALVTHVVDSSGNIKSSEIIQAINNDGSNILLNADKINLNTDEVLVTNTSGGTVCKIDKQGKAQFAGGRIYIDDYTAHADAITNSGGSSVVSGLGINIQEASSRNSSNVTHYGVNEIQCKDHLGNQTAALSFGGDSQAVNHPSAYFSWGIAPKGTSAHGVVFGSAVTYPNSTTDSGGVVTLNDPSAAVFLSNNAGTGNQTDKGYIQIGDGFERYESLSGTFVFNNSNIKVGNDTGITQTINIPSTTSGKHYEMVIKKGIIVGCTEVND